MPLDLIGRVHRTIVVEGCDPIYHQNCAEMFARRFPAGAIEAWESVSVPKEDPKDRARRIRRAKLRAAKEQQEALLQKSTTTHRDENTLGVGDAAASTTHQATTKEVPEPPPATPSDSKTNAVPEELEEIELAHRIFIVFKSPDSAQVATGMSGMSFAVSTNRLSVWIANDTTVDGRPRLTTSNSHAHVLDKNATSGGYYEDLPAPDQKASNLLRMVGFKSMRDESDAPAGSGGGLLMLGGPSGASQSKSQPNRKGPAADTEEQMEIIRRRKELLAALGGNTNSFRPDVGAPSLGEDGTDSKAESHTKTRIPNTMTPGDREEFLNQHFVRQCRALTILTEERARVLGDEVAVWERRVAEGERSNGGTRTK